MIQKKRNSTSRVGRDACFHTHASRGKGESGEELSCACNIIFDCRITFSKNNYRNLKKLLVEKRIGIILKLNSF